ncbi:ABC transporter ATP-binding protein [Nitratireductor sp. ZSWI3]|uniref:ABC transporter ATP-binding protein n=1 Tax=Nitratireductor sp. ZSWI3 TaxID=2966359 RepID=UPI00214FEDE0|nr:ABC transporter ATP-binding protein [Nitratireductor sp. ZSWI3]MCR4267444.1 ABC transporter ATP-binding protein [Nitratireductor sp. ZSWI3]
MLEDDRTKRPEIELRDVALGYANRLVFEALDLSVRTGRLTALCGPNGCGKSTALRAMRALLPAQAGNVLLKGRSVAEFSAKALAREIAMLTQNPAAPDEMTVHHLVSLGRYAHRTGFSSDARADRAAVAAALDSTNLSDLGDRAIGTLSGGQLQRVWIAMVLAQAAPVVLLDEPTNHLDIAHALEVLSLVRRLGAQEGKTVIVVLHDLNLAARFADDIVFFQGGKVAGCGPVEEVFRRELIEEVFGIECLVRREEAADRPYCIPLAACPGRRERLVEP